MGKTLDWMGRQKAINRRGDLGTDTVPSGTTSSFFKWEVGLIPSSSDMFSFHMERQEENPKGSRNVGQHQHLLQVIFPVVHLFVKYASNIKHVLGTILRCWAGEGKLDGQISDPCP